MKFTAALFAATACLAAGVAASPFTTVPVAATKWVVGQKVTITWLDRGAPALAAMPPMTIDLMTGANLKQVVVTNLANNVKATVGKLAITVPKFTGPPGPFYFIRYTSANQPYFSTRFDIQGVTGTIPGFNPADINGTASASARTPSSTAGPTGRAGGAVPVATVGSEPPSQATAAGAAGAASSTSVPASAGVRGTVAPLAAAALAGLAFAFVRAC